jgi:hypothetical protein
MRPSNASRLVRKDPERSKLSGERALEFITTPRGLGLGIGDNPPLYPAQMDMIKKLYGLSLGALEKTYYGGKK